MTNHPMTKVTILLTVLLLAGCSAALEPSPDQASSSVSSLRKYDVVNTWYGRKTRLCWQRPLRHYRVSNGSYLTCQVCHKGEDCHITQQYPDIDEKTGCAILDRTAVCGNYTIETCDYYKHECFKIVFSSSS